jgi:hypothetical protein
LRPDARFRNLNFFFESDHPRFADFRPEAKPLHTRSNPVLEAMVPVACPPTFDI